MFSQPRRPLGLSLGLSLTLTATLLLGPLRPGPLAANTGFDTAQCPLPLLVINTGRASLIYDPEMIATIPARAGLVPVLDRATGKVWYYDPAQDSLADILFLHGAALDDFRGPPECAYSAAGFPDPFQRNHALLPERWHEAGGGSLTGNAAAPLPQGGGDGQKASGDPAPQPVTGQSPSGACSDGPRNGTWRAEIGASRIEGCPAMMRQMFAQSPGALPGQVGAPGQLEFSCPFHPDTLELSRQTGVRWTPNGPNRWTTTDLGAQAFAMIPQGEGGGSHIRWDLTVLSPDEIDFTRSIEVILPAEAAAVLGTAPEGCRVTGSDRWIRVGD